LQFDPKGRLGSGRREVLCGAPLVLGVKIDTAQAKSDQRTSLPLEVTMKDWPDDHWGRHIIGGRIRGPSRDTEAFKPWAVWINEPWPSPARLYWLPKPPPEAKGRNMRTFTIELRVDHDDPEKDEIIKEAGMAVAKHWYTKALLIKDRQKPMVAMHSNDFFAQEDQINLAEDI
jgi:hypothetical protein